MAALIALAAVCLFAAGALAGIISVVAVAIRREERNLTLTSKAPDNVTRTGHWLTGLHVRAPAAPPPVTGRRRRSSPHRKATSGQAELVPWPTRSAGHRMDQRGPQPQPPDHLIVGATERSFGAAPTATAIE